MLRRRRFPALALLLALVGVGLGLPLFDAVVFHARPLETAERALLAEGGVAGHSQVCVLDQDRLETRVLLTMGTPRLPDLPPVRLTYVASPRPSAATPPPGLADSRAPPHV